MKAFIVERFGKKTAHVPEPELGKDDVLVQIRTPEGKRAADAARRPRHG